MTTEVENTETPEEVTLDSLAVTEQETAPEQEPAQAEPQEEIPEKYAGKSVTDLVRMHEETQRFVGQQANEIGELRKSLDTVIQANLPAPEDPPDFFEDPEKAVEAKIESHPDVLAAKQAVNYVKAEAAQQKLMAAHPDATEIVSSDEFAKWCGGSEYRKNLFKKANAYDLDAASELLSAYKETRSAAKEAENLDKGQRKADVKRASTGSAKGTGASPQKTYRRADIVQLIRDDPKRYEALAADIRAAYAKGLVK